MKKKDKDIVKAALLVVGVPLFVQGAYASGGLPIDRVHHWQIGAALSFIGAVL